MKKSLPLFALLLVMPLLSCAPTEETTDSSSVSSSAAIESIEIKNAFDGQEVDLLYAPARAYLESENPASFLASASSNPGDNTDGVTLRWKVSGGSGRYKLELSNDESFSNVYQTYSDLRSSVQSLTVYNLLPGKYYYRVSGANVISSVDSFLVKDDVRTINTNNAIINMRDLGGWKISASSRVKYGLLYRSASWANIDKTAETRLKGLGMKTELDIRYSNASVDYSSSEHPITGIDFKNFGMGQYDQILPKASKYNASSKANLKNIFEFLAKEENYPLTFHCTAGADRTGTLSFLINGLLGVSYADLCKDFELTSIYNSKRWRSNIVEGAFDDSGVMQDDSSNYVAFGLLYKEMMEGYAEEGEGLSDAIATYLQNECEISLATLDAIKAILIDKQ